MRIRSLLAAVAVAGALGAAGAQPAQAAPSAQDRAWMVAAHQSNLTEIAAGQAAQQKGTSAEVKELGAMFIQMHTQLDAPLKQAANQFGIQLPDAPSPAQQRALAEVSAKSGEAFDAAWIASQIAGHRQTLAATRKELEAGSDPTTLQLARTATPVVEQHLTELQQAAGQPAGVDAGTGGQAASVNPFGTPAGIAGLALIGVGAIALAGVAARRRRVTPQA